MNAEHGSRWVPTIFGIVCLAGAFFISGVGKGIIHIITLFIGGGLFIMGIGALYIGLFTKQDNIDKWTLGGKGQ
jgi:predicted exporter